ncbi:MAG TPA: acetyl-CoA carboxylase biotin carboxylase subunit [Phycisphaerae bacterium]|jgi:acetyl-CoA carboxylase biotin carboxylase subunit|nr:acetyl-CoA carboxylase biotin carboxylase subunit [Phycisphaerae bacterium]
MFQRILIANRGEIALRIIRACKELGVETVVVYSEADRAASYLKLADQAICIGPGPAAESYLNIPRIISAAEVGDVQAIHPGFGFLSENAHFASVCRECKIEFIGPSVEAMQMLGSKLASKELAKKCHVPLTPGSAGAITTEEEAVEVATRIGYPVIIKASAGGGGRGMRVAHNDITLRSSIKAAQSEAEAAFKDGTIFIEKYHEEPRHVEVQILGDKFGHVVHLWERDCTLQRRHQKLVEESPCPVIDQKTREELCDSAVRLAKAAGYYSACTCEFIMDKDRKFYFLEVNTRIQVEHPVTELVTGVDLIKWQLKIAAGEKLTLNQKDIPQNGCAIECRINAEDPERNFMPSPGTLEEFIPPGGPHVRMETHAHQGYKVPPNYDSMIAKLLVHGATRDEAITTMRRALDEFRVGPIKTTIPLHRQIMANQSFRQSKVDTGWIERTYKPKQ